MAMKMRCYMGQAGHIWNRTAPYHNNHSLRVLSTLVDCFSPAYSIGSISVFSQSRLLLILLTEIISDYNTIQAFWSIQSWIASSSAFFILPFFIPIRLLTSSLKCLSRSLSMKRLICPIWYIITSYQDIKLSLYLDKHKLFIFITR